MENIFTYLKNQFAFQLDALFQVENQIKKTGFKKSNRILSIQPLLRKHKENYLLWLFGRPK